MVSCRARAAAVHAHGPRQSAPAQGRLQWDDKPMSCREFLARNDRLQRLKECPHVLHGFPFYHYWFIMRDFRRKGAMAGLREDTPAPTEIKLHRKSRLLEISFADGKTFRLPCEFLRVHSP